MKKFIKLFLMIFVMIISFTFSINTSADTGPKPYIDITIDGNTEGMYMTLLSSSPAYGPYRVYDAEDSSFQNETPNEIKLKFRNYVDNDNFYFLETYAGIENHYYHWGYYPPTTFKILIYDSVKDIFITDNVIYNRTSFGSFYKVTLNEDIISSYEAPGESSPDEAGEGMVCIVPVDTTGYQVLAFVIRLLICLAIEVSIAGYFRFGKNEIRVITIVNVITQIFLNVYLAFDIHNNGFSPQLMLPFGYIFAEILIPIIEFVSYFLIFKFVKFKREKKRPFWYLLIYSVVANFASFVIGFGIISICEAAGLFI